MASFNIWIPFNDLNTSYKAGLLFNNVLYQQLEFMSRKLNTAAATSTMNEDQLFALRMNNMSTYSDGSNSIMRVMISVIILILCLVGIVIMH